MSRCAHGTSSWTNRSRKLAAMIAYPKLRPAVFLGEVVAVLVEVRGRVDVEVRPRHVVVDEPLEEARGDDRVPEAPAGRVLGRGSRGPRRGTRSSGCRGAPTARRR